MIHPSALYNDLAMDLTVEKLMCRISDKWVF